MKRLLLTGVAVLAAASLSACNVQVTPPQNTTSAAPATPAPAPAPAPAQPQQAASTGGTAPSAEVQPGQARQNFTVNNRIKRFCSNT